MALSPKTPSSETFHKILSYTLFTAMDLKKISGVQNLLKNMPKDHTFTHFVLEPFRQLNNKSGQGLCTQKHIRKTYQKHIRKTYQKTYKKTYQKT